MESSSNGCLCASRRANEQRENHSHQTCRCRRDVIDVTGLGRLSPTGDLLDNSIYVYSRYCPTGGPDLDLQASSPETMDLLCSLVLFTRPLVIVESGTYLAHTTLTLAKLCQDAHVQSHIWTADPVDRYTRGLQAQALAATGLDTLVTYYQTSYEEMLSQTEVHDIGLAYLDASSRDNPNLRWEHFQLTRPR